ncbi:c-type cytochrome [Pseudobacteriovorax antillogorgiicola]|uniref:Cytochrome c, mono-and diheme variants n=1 Tax=Pseudobacteriovorax antillogorgiicola TaxID=1513793 RepID=A0A1Y6BWT9_9BACT|nr:c-type cytochrome [Pseudobacteriovorax antillogorgiicola]TCS50252.1 quinol:cytochrome c oxidoreductase monoheme cytochrome subunit [Pseudobacteriovorax antillogorgiicola]SMF32947.1 Cytochrome c, mono-and diheme variants [Pseudobacteriovorax antillogorgiicola]
MKLKIFSAFVILGSLVLSGCKEGRNVTKLQYMPDMADNPTVKTQESYLNPPEHSVATSAILYPATMETAEAELEMPPALAHPAKLEMNLAQGKKLYNTYCTVCHGADGRGKGTLGASYPIGVPDISRSDLAARKDGFFFVKISKGGAMMPSYGHATSPHERWQIISYLRTLQGK